MEKSMIYVGSITYALSGKNVLRDHGIRVYIERVNNIEETHGCGYALVINGNIDKAEHILRSEGVKILGRSQKT